MILSAPTPDGRKGDAPALSRRSGRYTGLAGVAADDGAGCQTLVVGEVCLVHWLLAKRPVLKRNYRLPKQLLQGAEPDDKTRDLIGQIAAARATLALTQYQVENIIAQSRRALEYLHPDNLSFRFTAIWTLGFAYQLRGDRAAAGRAYTEALSISQASGNIFHH